MPLADAPGTHAEHADDGQLDAAVGHRPGHGLAADGGDAVLGRPAGLVDDVRARAFLGSGGLHGAQRPQEALQGPAHASEGVLRALLRGGDARHQAREGDADGHHGGEGDAEQHRVEQRHHDQGPDQQNGPVDEADDAGRGRLPQEHRVGGDAGDQFARRPSGQVEDLRAEEAADEGGADPEHDPLGEAAQQDRLPQAHGRPQDEQHGEERDGAPQFRAAAEGVEDGLGHHGRGQFHGGAQQGEQQAEREGAPVRTGVFRQQAEPGEARRGRDGCRYRITHAAK